MDYSQPYLGNVESWRKGHQERTQRHLREHLVNGRSMNRLGMLLYCWRFAQEEPAAVPGVWADVEGAFQDKALGRLCRELDAVNTFRNRDVAHGEEHLGDPQEAWEALAAWLRCLKPMAGLVRG